MDQQVRYKVAICGAQPSERQQPCVVAAIVPLYRWLVATAGGTGWDRKEASVICTEGALTTEGQRSESRAWTIYREQHHSEGDRGGEPVVDIP